MKTKFILILFLALFLSLHAFPKRNVFKRPLQDAEYYYLYEDYQEALYLYKDLDTSGYSNANIKYRIGICYIHSDFEKEKAIPYLKEAAKNVSPEYDEADLFEKSSPYETYYYLGKVFLIDNQLDSAARYFAKYRSTLPKDDLQNLIFVNNEILSCRIADDQKPRAQIKDIVNAGSAINSRFSEVNPVVTSNEDILIYTSKLQFYDAIFFSKKINDQWSSPVNITPQIGTDGRYYPCFLSFDGNTLLLVRESIFESNIYMSSYSRETGKWSKAEEIKGAVNSSNYETHACLSKDGNTLYFTSNRPEGYGGMDIYVSHKSDDNDWGKPENLGTQINTPFNETAPFICENNNKLYFSSQGHFTLGGYDYFYTERNAHAEWTLPENVGYPINTTDDNIFFYPVKNGKVGYYPTYKKDSEGKYDIYRVEFK